MSNMANSHIRIVVQDLLLSESVVAIPDAYVQESKMITLLCFNTIGSHRCFLRLPEFLQDDFLS